MKALGIFFLTSLLVACGGDDDGGGGGSGIASNKQVSDLTQEEATQLCNAHQDDFDAIAVGSCRLVTASIAPDQCAMCDSSASVDCTGTDTAQVADCTVTVGELETCLSQMGTAFGGVTCDPSQAAPSPPPCAQELQTKCSGLFGGGAPSADGGF